MKKPWLGRDQLHGLESMMVPYTVKNEMGGGSKAFKAQAVRKRLNRARRRDSKELGGGRGICGKGEVRRFRKRPSQGSRLSEGQSSI